MPVKKLQDYLDSHQIKYLTMLHSPAFTAQEIAASIHVSGKQVAKPVIIKVNGSLAMIVVSATEHINFAALQTALGHLPLELAKEVEFKDRFAGCEVGAMPPLGHLYEMPVYISRELSRQENIIFNAGSHSELIQMHYADFERLTYPKILDLA
jgi:Ala-tRNA(Pro) deacylase